MIPRDRKSVKAVALFLVFTLVQFYVQASSAGSVVSAQDTTSAQRSGVLSTTGNRDIQVDKNGASTGATILDGMTLETPDCVAATVRWGSLAEVNLATNTIAVVNYSEGRVKVSLRQGCARVSGGQNVDLTIETPDGNMTTASGSNRKSAQACVSPTTKGEFNPKCPVGAPVSGGTAGLGVASHTGWGVLVGAIGEIALITLAIVGTRGKNPSPTTP